MLSLRWTIGLSLVGLLAAGAAPAAAQCRPADDDASWLLGMAYDYTLRSDSTWLAARDSLRISAPSRTGVVLVTTAATCRSANTAYQKAATGDRSTLSGQVYVIQSGTTLVVWDPAYRYVTGGDPIYMVFDSNWLLKKMFR